MVAIPCIVAMHFICDYFLRNSFIETKDINIMAMLLHVAIYGIGMTIAFKMFGKFAVWKMLMLMASHMAIDYYKIIIYEPIRNYVDQFMHLAIAFFLFLI